MLFHSCTVTGLMDGLNCNFDRGMEMCCSSNKSASLFGRHIVLVIDDTKAERTLECAVDYDAQKNFGYDEIRIQFETEEDFFSSVKEIIISDEIADLLDKAEEVEADEMIDELIEITPEWADFDDAQEVIDAFYDFFRYNENNFSADVIRASSSDYSLEFLNF